MPSAACTDRAPSCSSECELLACLPNGLKPFSGRCKKLFFLALGRQCASCHVCTFPRCVISTRGPSLPPAKQHSPISRSSVTESSAAVLLGCFHRCFWVAPESYPEQGIPCTTNACHTVMSRQTALHRSLESDVGEVLRCKTVYDMEFIESESFCSWVQLLLHGRGLHSIPHARLRRPWLPSARSCRGYPCRLRETRRAWRN